MPRGIHVVVAMLAVGSTLAACATSQSDAASGRTVSRETSQSPVTAPPTGAESLPPPAAGGAKTTGEPTPTPKPPASGTGIAGVTVLGPVCPVQRGDRPCPPRPVSARLAVLNASTNASVTTIDSDAQGHFSVALQPGRYLLRAISVGGGPPHSPTLVSVTVQAGHYATVTIQFDSGIR
jgi:hypothetical protein